MTQEAGTPRDFFERLQKMVEDAVAKLARSGMLRNASISEGGTFTIKGGILRILHPASRGGGTGAYFGPIYSAIDATYQGTGITVEDADGTDIFTARSDEATGNPLCVMWDSQQNAVVYTDAGGSGFGLGRPFIPFNFYSARFTADPSVSTSGTFETLWIATAFKINPAAYVAASAYADSGSTGEIRVLVNGVQLGTTQSITSSPASYAFGPSVVSGSIGSYVTVQIQGRVASGAGAIRILPQVGTGFPSP